MWCTVTCNTDGRMWKRLAKWCVTVHDKQFVDLLVSRKIRTLLYTTFFMLKWQSPVKQLKLKIYRLIVGLFMNQAKNVKLLSNSDNSRQTKTQTEKPLLSRRKGWLQLHENIEIEFKTEAGKYAFYFKTTKNITHFLLANLHHKLQIPNLLTVTFIISQGTL